MWSRMVGRRLLLGLMAALVAAPAGLLVVAAPAEAQQQLVIYSGRSRALVQPLVRQFERETGIRVQVRYGATAQLAMLLEEEGARSPADLFWSQDAGALGSLAGGGRLVPLPESLVSDVPEQFRNPERLWVGTSGRARVLAYSPTRLGADQLPGSVLELADPRWRGRVGWAPANGSFQAFVTAMRHTLGEPAARQWLLAVKLNQPQAYPNNTAILQAIAAGEIDLGITNHYYLLQYKKADEQFPVEQAFFGTPEDIGNLVNVSGVARLRTSRNEQAAQRFVEFLLSPRAQQYVTSEIFEYPMIDGVIPNERLLENDKLLRYAPPLGLDKLEDLKGTLDLLRDVGLL